MLIITGLIPGLITVSKLNNWPTTLISTSQSSLPRRKEKTEGVCHIVALPFTFFFVKKYLKTIRKDYGNSNISPCKKYNLQTNPLKQTKIL
jgi:hypothetical protein